MSQRKFQHNNYAVLTGWDRPLQYHFLLIEDITTPLDDEGIVFNNLHRRNPGMTLREIEDELNKLNIPIPPGLISDLKNDKITNVGNLTKDYGRTHG